MLVTYTFSSFANLPAQAKRMPAPVDAKQAAGPAPFIPGTLYPDSPAYAGGGLGLVGWFVLRVIGCVDG
jgi:hypothetical protein